MLPKSVKHGLTYPLQVGQSHPRIVSWSAEDSARPHTQVSTCARSATSRNSSKICGHLSMILSKDTDVESNGRDALIPKPKTGCVTTGRDACIASDGLPCYQKCRQHGLTYLHRLDNGIQGSSNCAGLQDRNTTQVSQRARRFGLQQAKLLQNLGHLLMFLSRGLTCYTDVESNGRDAPYQNPNRLPNVRPTGKRHACTRR
jgi:hypothetical protein